jgi:serine O-acetyltransferase
MYKSREAFQIEKKQYYYGAYGTVNPPLKRKIRLWIYHLGLQCVFVYRFGQLAYEIKEKHRIWGLFYLIIYKVLDYFVKVVYNVDIDAADIGPGLYIGHVGTIYIGPCKIGHNFCVTHNVTIAEDITTIGNNVWIGTGSVIHGAATIGNDVTISAGSILSRDIPDKCLVGGNPARLLLRDYDNSELILKVPE